jgi:aryl-alcohol dehydrogenase-like predicted oxidoreductase
VCLISEQKLALGTVQFGLAYGVANKIGMTAAADAGRTLEFARGLGINTLDTAVGYGQSEAVLGALGVDGFRIVTKLPEIPSGESNVRSWVAGQVRGSMERLRVSKLSAVLLHRPGQLLEANGDRLYSALRELKECGVVGKIGVSIYDPSELEYLVSRFEFDLVQSPLSILDRRLIETGWASRLIGEGVEIHARSCFLQGLLLMPIQDRPVKFGRFDPIWREWQRWLDANNLSSLEACVRYVVSCPEISRVVIGVDSVSQLAEIASSAKGAIPELPHWPCSPPALLLNPSNWTSL